MKIKCLLCGDIIESKSVHDLVFCKCESCYIDGGSFYAHIGAKDFSMIVLNKSIIINILKGGNNNDTRMLGK